MATVLAHTKLPLRARAGQVANTATEQQVWPLERIRDQGAKTSTGGPRAGLGVLEGWNSLAQSFSRGFRNLTTNSSGNTFAFSLDAPLLGLPDSSFSSAAFDLPGLAHIPLPCSDNTYVKTYAYIRLRHARSAGSGAVASLSRATMEALLRKTC